METTEQIIQKLHPHPLYFFWFYALGILLTIAGIFLFWPLAILGIFVGGLGEISRRAETFYILESGVARGYKMLASSRKFIEYDSIQNLGVSQSFSETLFKIGDVHFDTAGTNKVEMVFTGVADPYGIENIVRQKMKKPTA